MSKTEETDKLSFKEYIKMLPKEEIYFSVVKWEVIFKVAESFASMRVEQAKKEWEKEKLEIIKEYQDEVDAFKSILYSKED